MQRISDNLEELVGKPTCAKCQKSVDRVTVLNVSMDAILITAHCHGEKQNILIPDAVILNAQVNSISLNGIAFETINESRYLYGESPNG